MALLQQLGIRGGLVPGVLARCPSLLGRLPTPEGLEALQVHRLACLGPLCTACAQPARGCCCVSCWLYLAPCAQHVRSLHAVWLLRTVLAGCRQSARRCLCSCAAVRPGSGAAQLPGCCCTSVQVLTSLRRCLNPCCGAGAVWRAGGAGLGHSAQPHHAAHGRRKGVCLGPLFHPVVDVVESFC